MQSNGLEGKKAVIIHRVFCFPVSFGFRGDSPAPRVNWTAAAGLCWLAIWAGLSKRHWFLPATAVWLGLVALIPIRAYRPLELFLFVLPITAVVAWRIRRAVELCAVLDELKRIEQLREPTETTLARDAACDDAMYVWLAAAFPTRNGNSHRSVTWARPGPCLPRGEPARCVVAAAAS